jgi:hypothetical protein
LLKFQRADFYRLLSTGSYFMNKQSILKLSALALAASMVASLAGCGGGSDEAEPTPVPVPVPAPAPAPATPTGSATGVFSDAPVEGLAYSAAPSGSSGSTNALGQFTYNAGDTISFKLGALTLGAVPAAATVTPLELAAGNTDKLKNLLVLLQSLDADGVAANGITIPAKSAEAVTASIDLSQAPASFASSANAGLTAAMTAGGISRAITDNAAADAHFLAQANRLLSSHVWVSKTEDANGMQVNLLRFGSSGEYAYFGVENGVENGVAYAFAGIEFGTAKATLVDARGFQMTSQVEIDTDGGIGLSGVSASDRVRVEGDKLLYVEGSASGGADRVSALSKAENDPKGIVGVWAIFADRVKTQTFVFWANGKFGMFDPEGDAKCGRPGLEYGDYSYDATSKVLKVLKVNHDTNGCAGFNDNGVMPSATFTLSADGGSANLAYPGDGEYKAIRVSN